MSRPQRRPMRPWHVRPLYIAWCASMVALLGVLIAFAVAS